MVVFDEEKIWIVDFKTESFMHQKVSDIQQKYGGQLALYKEAIQAIYKNNHIETWLYSTLDDHAIRGE